MEANSLVFVGVGGVAVGWRCCGGLLYCLCWHGSVVVKDVTGCH